MAQKLFFFLFLLFSQSSLAAGEIAGSFRHRFHFAQTQDKSHSLFLNQSRLHLKARLRPSAEFEMQTEALLSYSYGEQISIEDSLRIYPSAVWAPSRGLELRIGRNLFENRFHQFVSLNDYESFFYVFDGVFLEYSADILSANLWAASLPNRRYGAAQIEELKYGFGFFLDIESEADSIDYFNIYAAYLGDSFLKSDSEKMSRYGLGLKGMISLLSLAYDFTAAVHSRGLQFKAEESMYHLRLSFFYPQFFDSLIFAGYHIDSSEYKPWLYDRHRHAGLLDLFLWGNLRYYFAGFSLSPALFDMKVSFYDLHSSSRGFIQPGYFGALLKPKGRALPVKGFQALGRELDIEVEKEIGRGFNIHFLAGVFFPKTDLGLLKGEDFYSHIQITGSYKF